MNPYAVVFLYLVGSFGALALMELACDVYRSRVRSASRSRGSSSAPSSADSRARRPSLPRAGEGRR